MVIVFQQKKTILPPKNQKIMCYWEDKTKFFAFTANWYKYQLIVASC